MKVVIRSFLILTFSTCMFDTVKAQFQFPDSAARWVQVFKQMTTPPPLPVFTVQERYHYCLNGQDTLINSIEYTRLEKCHGGYKGALRKDGGKVFYVPGDSIQEYLLYDFDVNEGDTVRDVYYEIEFGQSVFVQDMVVWGVQQNSFYGGRKQIYLDDVRWIEGIGADAGLLTGDWINISGFQLEMECMSLQDSILFPDWNYGQAGSCILNTGIDEWDPEEFTSYPNPTSGMLSINLREVKSVSVFTIDGRRIELVDNQVSGSTLDLSSLPSGLYLLDLTTEQGRFSQKVIKE